MPSTCHSQESLPLTTVSRTSTDDSSACTLDDTVGVDSSLRGIHPAISSWFLGPKAENGDALNNYVSTILKDLVDFRRKYAPEDEEFISAATMSSPSFIENASKLKATVDFLSDFLPQHSVPFYSPRYMAYMANEVSLPAILGNLMASLYNQNNLAPQGGPLTTVIEFDVGQQLCKMLGFSVTRSKESSRTAPTAWGHITCDGSVANTEAMWAARNLKYYPLSLKMAVDHEPPVAILATRLEICLCHGGTKPLSQCTAWDLLNLTSHEILDLPSRICAQFGWSMQGLQEILKKYLIQTTGKDELERYFAIQSPAQFMVSKASHYSWPKGAALTGVGSQNVIGVPVDDQARLDCNALEGILDGCLSRRQPVYGVILTIGTTEHGAVDSISQVIAMRERCRDMGLSFLIHADAAWGGYFTSMLVPEPEHTRNKDALDDPLMFVNPYTERELRHLRFADSITVDPHKSGYIAFPAGGLCYRDGRLRHLLTWTSPVLGSPKEDASRIGVYGVEGSKSGAPPVAAWMSHEVIGLHKGGYGLILGQVVFNAIRMYAHWATMSIDHSELLVVPFVMLPSERRQGSSDTDIDAERRLVRDLVLTRTSEELSKDPRARMLVQALGPDLAVNAFACNFRIDGKINQDISEANLLNERIYDRLSFSKLTDDLNNCKLILMSSVLCQKEYRDCLTKFKRRLGLAGDADLRVLVNVPMSPFACKAAFDNTLAEAFMKVAEEEAAVSVGRNTTTPVLHAFVLQGNSDGLVHLVHLPCFGAASQRAQIILSGELSGDVSSVYREARMNDPCSVFIATSMERIHLSSFYSCTSMRVSISKLGEEGLKVVCEGNLVRVTTIKIRDLSSRFLNTSYPSRMPFYLYGRWEDIHLDHIVLRAPNAQITATSVGLHLEEGDQEVVSEGLKQGLVAIASGHSEHLMQPFTTENASQLFRSNAEIEIDIYEDNSSYTGSSGAFDDAPAGRIAHGTITLGKCVFVDAYMINADNPPFSHVSPVRSEGELQVQDHPIFRGDMVPRVSTDDQLSWRKPWDDALASRIP